MKKALRLFPLLILVFYGLVSIPSCKKAQTQQDIANAKYNDTMQNLINLFKGEYFIKSITVTPAIGGSNYVYQYSCDSGTLYSFLQPNPKYTGIPGSGVTNHFLQNTYSVGQMATGVDSLYYESFGPPCNQARYLTKSTQPLRYWSLTALPDSLIPGWYLTGGLPSNNWKYAIKAIYYDGNSRGYMTLQHTTADGHVYTIMMINEGGRIGIY